MTDAIRTRALECLNYQNAGSKYGQYKCIYIVDAGIYLEKYVAEAMKIFDGSHSPIEVIPWNEETREEAARLFV